MGGIELTEACLEIDTYLHVSSDALRTVSTDQRLQNVLNQIQRDKQTGNLISYNQFKFRTSVKSTEQSNEEKDKFNQSQT